MTRETKIGLAMALLLIGVFGFLVYKRYNRPADSVAQTEASESDTEAVADGDLTLTKDDEFSPAGASAPKILPVAGQTRPIPQDEPDDDEDPFGGTSSPAPAANRNIPKLPTQIPDDSSEATVAETDDPFFGAAESEDSTSPAMAVQTAPALEFDAVESEDQGEFVVEQPVVITPSVRQPATPAFEADDEEATVSVQARGKIPDEAFDFGEEEADDGSMEIEVVPQRPARNSAQQLVIDDSSGDDRYGDFEPTEFANAASSGSPKIRSTGFSNAEPERTAITITGNRHVVESGENFWSISQKKYGTGRYFQALAAANQSRIPDAGKMKPGVEVLLPPASELERKYASLISSSGPAEPGAAAGGSANASGEFFMGSDGRPMYRIGAGDTLSGIAQRYLGRARRWEQILEMNRDVLKDGNSLKVGAVLRLPGDAAQLQLSTPSRAFR